MTLRKEQDLDQHPMAHNVALADSVPIIDINALANGQATQQEINEIAQACKEWGFFQVVNHGVSEELIKSAWKRTKQFFALPMTEKESLLRTKDNPWGYYNNELTKNQRDKKEVFDYTHSGTDPIYGAKNRWLTEQKAFKSAMLEYYAACSHLSMQLLQAFCQGMDLPPDFLYKDFEGNHTGFIRLNYYPVDDPMKGSRFEPQAEVGLGVHHHTDAGAFTILLQDEVGGLQVHKDGHWHDIPPTPNAFVINTADMMQVWSNDRYKAAVHRVQAMTTTDRYSIPFFFNPAAGAKISPLPTVISADRPKRYQTIEWAQFRGKRSEGDYADYGAEVQISQFKI
ncbi:MAG: isopenicillin N synthase-like dioxygenase [Gammaproteobacteria bacterium]|jgi:isopenicillin N synthase-like dioxygenase